MEFMQPVLFIDGRIQVSEAPLESRAKAGTALRDKKHRRPLTAEERQHVVDLYVSDVSLKDICATVGCTTSAMYSALTRAGVPRRIASRGRLRTLCEICNEPMRYVPPVSRAKGLGRYCSQACMGVAKRLPPSERADSATELLCSRCKKMRPVDHFYPDKSTRGRRYQCKWCESDQRGQQAQVPEDPVQLRRRQLRASYGISMDDYDALFEAQEGRCAICGAQKEPWQPGGGFEGRDRFLAVDHSHADGHVRGLLCGHCNRGLGQFKDNLSAMLAAVEYLRSDATAPEAIQMAS